MIGASKYGNMARFLPLVRATLHQPIHETNLMLLRCKPGSGESLDEWMPLYFALRGLQ